jgi:hypothetical protein
MNQKSKLPNRSSDDSFDWRKGEFDNVLEEKDMVVNLFRRLVRMLTKKCGKEALH